MILSCSLHCYLPSKYSGLKIFCQKYFPWYCIEQNKHKHIKNERFSHKENYMLDFKSFFGISTKYICIIICSLVCDWPMLADPDSWLEGAGDMISDDVRMFPINLVSVNPSVSGDWAPLQPQILQVTKLEWSETGGILVSRIPAFY